ncbi:MAG TPA: MBL fold metallo-hydrolase [Solirubrobacterales bacterium]|nr:MBL fold metallo-hydrolase [Solirubrobacterales bacterium]
MTAHLRVLRPAPGLLAFYDGRVPGYRVAPQPNWVDEGAISLGIASYAVVDGDEALVYDTHVSVEHGRAIRRTLEAEGARRLTVLFSHWHLDHVAGTEAFADCEILAGERTAELLFENREAIEAGELEGPPAIAPLVMPTRTIAAETELAVGQRQLRLLPVEIHSDDAVVVWEEATATLLAGDTVEDTVTYVDEPQGFAAHLRDLDRLLALEPEHVLPNHGDPDSIAAGGYGPGLLSATQDYVRFLQRCRREPALCELPLREVVADAISAGDLRYFEPYVAVHRHNLATVLADPPPGE